MHEKNETFRSVKKKTSDEVEMKTSNDKVQMRKRYRNNKLER